MSGVLFKVVFVGLFVCSVGSDVSIEGSGTTAIAGEPFTITCTGQYDILLIRLGNTLTIFPVYNFLGANADNTCKPSGSFNTNYTYMCTNDSTTLTYSTTIPGAYVTEDLHNSNWTCTNVFDAGAQVGFYTLRVTKNNATNPNGSDLLWLLLLLLLLIPALIIVCCLLNQNCAISLCGCLKGKCSNKFPDIEDDKEWYITQWCCNVNICRLKICSKKLCATLLCYGRFLVPNVRQTISDQQNNEKSDEITLNAKKQKPKAGLTNAQKKTKEIKQQSQEHTSSPGNGAKQGIRKTEETKKHTEKQKTEDGVAVNGKQVEPTNPPIDTFAVINEEGRNSNDPANSTKKVKKADEDSDKAAVHIATKETEKTVSDSQTPKHGIFDDLRHNKVSPAPEVKDQPMTSSTPEHIQKPLPGIESKPS